MFLLLVNCINCARFQLIRNKCLYYLCIKFQLMSINVHFNFYCHPFAIALFLIVPLSYLPFINCMTTSPFKYPKLSKKCFTPCRRNRSRSFCRFPQVLFVKGALTTRYTKKLKYDFVFVQSLIKVK